MTTMVKGLFGGDKSSGQMDAITAQQNDQRAELAAEKARLTRAEEGRAKLRQSRRGLLAFLDEDPTISQTLGGKR